MFDVRDDVIDLCETGNFLYKDNLFKRKEKEESEEKEKSEKELDENKFFKNIENKSESINYELFKDYFDFAAPTVLAKKLFETKNKNKTVIF